jgi:uncharacterized protein YjbI with pentapeptide repeats
MEARHAWWQKARKSLEVFGIIVVCILIIALLAVIVMVYLFNVNVSGLRGKTLWDWLQLLIIPLALAIIALVFQLANTRTERQIAQERYEQDQQIALDKQREDLLQAYLDRISELLLKDSLRTSTSKEVRNVARVRTITVLTQLDSRRIGYVFDFLREAGLMSTTSNDNVVSLSDAILAGVDWSRVLLRNVNLSGVYLNRANLSNALIHFSNFSNARLSRANLRRTNLSGANLSETDLTGADLTGADLNGAKVTPEQLTKAKSLKDATMPDGSIHP